MARSGAYFFIWVQRSDSIDVDKALLKIIQPGKQTERKQTYLEPWRIRPV